MTQVSNLYADKIFNEHPTALWALDEDTSATPINLENVPNLPYSDAYGIKLRSYGFSNFNGYYLGTNSKLFSSNSGIPMVYGASNITTIYPSSVEGEPSIIIPSLGFLTDRGKSQEYTFEVWIRIHSSSITEKRIFGPTESTDGLYVHGPFITLKVGPAVLSHYIGEWGKPMLLGITYSNNNISLLINGEEVANTSILFSSLELSGFDVALASRPQYSWLGFYAYDSVEPISLDCIAIYPYKVSALSMKAKFVYAQGVDFPELTNTSYSDVPVSIDYKNSKYSKNYLYPAVGKWNHGFINNMKTDDYFIKPFDYTLPTIIFKDTLTTQQDWYDASELIQSISYTHPASTGSSLDELSFIKLTPSDEGAVITDWTSKAYISFPGIGILKEKTECLYGVFRYATLPTSEEVLFSITDESGKYLKAVVVIDGSDVKINYRFGSKNRVISTFVTDTITENTLFSAGIIFKDLASRSGTNRELSLFLSKVNSYKLTVGSEKDFTKQFSGYIHRVGLDDAFNLKNISSYFSNGFASTANSNYLFQHYASYTLIATSKYSNYTLDIAAYGYWEDYLPLSYFTKLDNGTYKTTFMQFNIDFPESENYDEDENIVTDNNIIKSYVKFSELVDSNGNANIDTGLKNATAILEKSHKEITPTASWKTEKYEVVDNSVIYMPTSGVTNQNDLKVVTAIEFRIPGILNNPVKLRYLRYSAQTVFSNERTPIGTKFGKDVYSYTTVGSEKSYSGKNPLSIYTGSTPHLFLTKYSGIHILGDNVDGTRGIEIPINSTAMDYYKISAIQFALVKPKLFTSTNPEKVVRVVTSDTTVTLYSQRIDNDSARLYLVSSSGSNRLFIDGNEYSADESAVTNLGIIRKKEWHLVAIKFTNLLDIGGHTDAVIEIVGDYVVNNIADYQITESEEGNSVRFSYWNDYAATTWADLLTQADNDTWQEVVAFTSSTVEGIDPAKVYGLYFGVSRVVGETDTFELRTQDYKYKAINELKWLSGIVKPV